MKWMCNHCCLCVALVVISPDYNLLYVYANQFKQVHAQWNVVAALCQRRSSAQNKHLHSHCIRKHPRGSSSQIMIKDFAQKIVLSAVYVQNRFIMQQPAFRSHRHKKDKSISHRTQAYHRHKPAPYPTYTCIRTTEDKCTSAQDKHYVFLWSGPSAYHRLACRGESGRMKETDRRNKAKQLTNTSSTR